MQQFYSVVLMKSVTKYLTNKRTDGRSGFFQYEVRFNGM